MFKRTCQIDRKLHRRLFLCCLTLWHFTPLFFLVCFSVPRHRKFGRVQLEQEPCGQWGVKVVCVLFFHTLDTVCRLFVAGQVLKRRCGDDTRLLVVVLRSGCVWTCEQMLLCSSLRVNPRVLHICHPPHVHTPMSCVDGVPLFCLSFSLTLLIHYRSPSSHTSVMSWWERWAETLRGDAETRGSKREDLTPGRKKNKWNVKKTAVFWVHV